MSEQSAAPILFYDVSTDERRPVTQDDVDKFGYFVRWNLNMRDIVSALTSHGAGTRFTNEQLDRAKEALGLL